MKYLIHGDDVTVSRKYLTGLIEGYKGNFLDGKALSLSILEEHMVSQSLFEEKKAVILENLFKNSKKKELIKSINDLSTDNLLVVWEENKLAKNVVSTLKNITVKEFLLPTYYFQFLDQLTPRNQKKIFTLYQELLKTYAPEQLLFSLIKRVRQLVILSTGGMNDEIAKMPPWMRSKLQQQARAWPKDKLVSFYKKLQEAEIRLKTGALPTDLSKHLDIVILTQL